MKEQFMKSKLMIFVNQVDLYWAPDNKFQKDKRCGTLIETRLMQTISSIHVLRE